jgi:hypothetical protein
VLLLNECLLLLLFISLPTQSGNFWLHPRKVIPVSEDSSNLSKAPHIFHCHCKVHARPHESILRPVSSWHLVKHNAATDLGTERKDNCALSRDDTGS